MNQPSLKIYTNLPRSNWLFKQLSKILFTSLNDKWKLVHKEQTENAKPYSNVNNIFFEFEHDTPQNKQFKIALNSLCRALFQLKFVLREEIE